LSQCDQQMRNGHTTVARVALALPIQQSRTPASLPSHKTVTKPVFVPVESAHHSRACCLGSADLRPVFLRPARSAPQRLCSNCSNVGSALVAVLSSCSCFVFSNLSCRASALP